MNNVTMRNLNIFLILITRGKDFDIKINLILRWPLLDYNLQLITCAMIASIATPVRPHMQINDSVIITISRGVYNPNYKT